MSTPLHAFRTFVVPVGDFGVSSSAEWPEDLALELGDRVSEAYFAFVMTSIDLCWGEPAPLTIICDVCVDERADGEPFGYWTIGEVDHMISNPGFQGCLTFCGIPT